MLIWNPGKLTKDGKALLAKAQAGKCAIQITKAQSGSGSYTSSEDISQRTALKTVKQTFPISNKVINTDSALVLKITMENSTLTAGYDITEFGVFASDPDKGEILYSIATASTSDYMPAYNGVVPSVINMSYYLEVANASTVTIKSAGALALQSDLEALEARVTAVESDALRGYGARRKVGASSTTWERVGAAIGLVAKAAVGNGTVQNDFMASVYPYNSVKPCNVAEDMSVNAYLGDADFQWDGSKWRCHARSAAGIHSKILRDRFRRSKSGNTDGWQQVQSEDAILTMRSLTEIARARRFTFRFSPARSMLKERNWNQKQESSRHTTRPEHSSEDSVLQRATSGVWMMSGRCTCSTHCSL